MLEEGGGEIVGIPNHLSVDGLAHQLFHVHHDIEGPLGLDAADAVDGVHPADNVIPAFFKGFPHGLHLALRALKSGHRRLLGNG